MLLLSPRPQTALLLRVLNYLLALFAGALFPTQTGINAQLRASVGNPWWATLISFAVGTLSVGLYLLIMRVPFPSELPPPSWKWIGGALGVAYVGLALILAPRLGAGALVSTVIAGQLIASLALDQFGWLGYAQHAITFPRVAGALLVAAGAWLIGRS